MNINNNIDPQHNKHEPHCASEMLHRKLENEQKFMKSNSNNVNEKSDINLNESKLNGGVISKRQSDKKAVSKRVKRWSPDEEVSCYLFIVHFFRSNVGSIKCIVLFP